MVCAGAVIGIQALRNLNSVDASGSGGSSTSSPGSSSSSAAGSAPGTGQPAPAQSYAPTGGMLSQYVAEFGPEALAAQQKYDIPAATLLGITSSESNYGAAPTYFGIICAGYPNCRSYISNGSDSNGQPVSFRVYSSYTEGIDDFVNLVRNHYPQAWADRHNPAQFLNDLVAGGYGPADWPGIILGRIQSISPYLNASQPA